MMSVKTKLAKTIFWEENVTADTVAKDVVAVDAGDVVASENNVCNLITPSETTLKRLNVSILIFLKILLHLSQVYFGTFLLLCVTRKKSEYSPERLILGRLNGRVVRRWRRT